jgi:hypothetical protein
VYAPRSTDATEATVLTPAAGAPHSDAFQVSTLAVLSGYQPYLSPPDGKFGGLDLLTRKYQQGTVNVTILDARTGTSQLSRWVSAFLGTALGKPQLPGCKAVLEESTDGGSTWNAYFTGRIVTVANQGAVSLTLQIRDNASDLNYEVFAGRPAASITYAGEPYVFPPGCSIAYGTQPITAPFAGTFGSSGVFRLITLATGATGYGRSDNVVTTALVAGAPSRTLDNIKYAAQPGLRLRFTTAGVTSKEMEVVFVERTGALYSPVTKVSRLWCRAVSSTSDPYYNAIDTGTIADATACTFAVRAPALASANGNVGASVLIADVHPVQLWKDLLDGKFGRLTVAGAVQRAFPYDSSAFSTLIADTSFPTLRFLITKPWKLQDFVEKQLLPLGLGMRLDGSGQVVPLDLRPIQASPTSTTIVNDDLADGTPPAWSEDRDQAITVFRVQTYVDYPINVAAPPNPTDGAVQAFNTTLLQTGVEEFIFPDFGSADLGEKTQAIDAQGLRSLPGETINGHDRHEWVAARAAEIVAAYKKPFSSPPQYLTTQLRRTSNTSGVEIGTWRLIDLDIVPGCSSNLRGENRLMLCVEKSPKGVATQYKWLDAGPNTVASQPTIGTPAQEASNTQNGVTVALTLNASSEVATIWINPTATSVGTVPAATDAGWRLAVPVGSTSGIISASATYTVRNLPANKRIWVRTRTEAVTGGKIASAFAFPSGTGYVATATITAISAIAAGTVSTKAANLTWTVGDATKQIVLRLTGAASQAAADALTPVDYVTLPAGATSYLLQGLDGALAIGAAGTVPALVTGPWWHADLYHIDGFGGSSAVDNLAAFHATGTAPTAPTPGGILVVRDYSTSPNPPATSAGLVPFGSTGMDIGMVVAPTGFGLDGELYRAPDSAGSSGTYALLATIPAADLNARGYVYRDVLPVTGTQYWYKWRHSGAGYAAGSYTAEVHAKAGWLPPQLVYTDNGQAVLGVPQTIQLAAPAFMPSSQASTWTQAGATLTPNVVGTQREYYAFFTVPDNCTITGVSLNGSRVAAGDVVQGRLYYTGVGSYVVSTVQDTRALASTGNETNATTTLSLPGSDSGAVRIYYYNVSLKSTTAATDALLYYVVITYVKTAYN